MTSSRAIREPYQCNKRSEYRLVLRGDNADERLTPIGRELGLMDNERWLMFEQKQQAIHQEMPRLVKLRIKQADAFSSWLTLEGAGQLRICNSGGITEKAGLHVDDLIDHGLADARLGHDVLEAAEIKIKYAGYLQRQQQQIEAVAENNNRELPQTSITTTWGCCPKST